MREVDTDSERFAEFILRDEGLCINFIEEEVGIEVLRTGALP